MHDWEFAWQILHALVTLAIAIYAYAADRYRAHRDQLEGLRLAHDERLRKLEDGLTATTARLAHLPASAEVAELMARVREMQAEFRATMPTVGVRLERIEDFLHSRGPR